MRLLLVDGSPVVFTLIQRLVPDGVEVEAVNHFEAARAICEDRTPTAAVVNLGPATLPWGELQDLCRQHTPPVPVLFESCIFQDPEDAGLSQLAAGSEFLRTPCPVEELREKIRELIRTAENGG